MKGPLGAAVAGLFALALILTGCSGSTSPGGTAPDPNAKIVLNFWGFADLPPALVKQYEAEHPNIKIQTKIGDYDAAHQGLLTALMAKQGPDVAQIAVDFMGEFVAASSSFQDLRTFGADSIKGDYLDWRWQAGVAKDGAVIGIPTDVGGMAIAYRTDLFKKAGLPTERAAVSALWPDWQGYLDTGKKYVAATGDPFVDSGKAILRAASNQADEKYYNANGELIYRDNPALREAWDLGVQAIESDLSANLATWSPAWLAGMANGGYATVPAPAWMLSSIQAQAPATKGKWDVATLPGVVGNDGGSFLAIPAASKNAQAAYDFISWMYAPEQQLTSFKEYNSFPSAPALFEDKAVTGYTNPFFRNAPIGRIYITSVEGLKGYPIGPDSRVIEQMFESAIGRVDQGTQPADAAWQQAITDADRETS